MIRIAYIILAHKNPEQLTRLIERLNSPYCSFFVHIDKKADISDFAKVRNIKSAEIHLVRREYCPWGSIGIVKATLNGFKQIAEARRKFDYVILLSGQDYPIKSNAYINNYLSQNLGKNFLEYFCIPNEYWPRGGLDRINRYWISFDCSICPYPVPINSLRGKVINYFLKFYFSKAREFPPYLSPYGGSQWFCITLDAVLYMLNFINKRPDYLKYHENSLIPDEMFFHSIMLNAGDKIASSIVNDNLKYINWNKSENEGIQKTKHFSPHPVMLSIEDHSDLKKSNKLFARKFCPSFDARILNSIDAEMLNN